MTCSLLPYRIVVAPRPTGSLSWIDRAINQSALEYGVTREQILGPSRKVAIYNARVCFAVIARKMLLLQLEAIGRILNRDHTCVIGMLKNADAWKGTYWEARYLRVEQYMKAAFESR